MYEQKTSRIQIKDKIPFIVAPLKNEILRYNSNKTCLMSETIKFEQNKSKSKVNENYPMLF